MNNLIDATERLVKAVRGQMYVPPEIADVEEALAKAKGEPMSTSDCCGAEDGPATYDGPFWSDIGICPDCREHCEFTEEQ